MTVLDPTLPCSCKEDSAQVFILQNAKSKTRTTFNGGSTRLQPTDVRCSSINLDTDFTCILRFKR